VRIAILGPLQVTRAGGDLVDLGGIRLRTLIIRLALEPGATVGTGDLITAVWGEDPPAGALNALQTLVSRLRRALPDVVSAGPTGYRLRLRPDQVDVHLFDRLAGAGRRALAGGDPGAATEHLGQALALWRGPALADVAQAGFARAAVARLTEARLAATEDWIEARLAGSADESLIAQCTELAATHPARERPHGLLMRALRDAGRPAEALRAYQRMSAILADELGVDPSPEITEVYLSVLRGTGEPRGNLRAALTSLVGREGELTAVASMITGARLVTLVGAGGSGKTRLATEAARRLGGEYPDGVWLAELAPVREGQEVLRVLAETLRLRFSPARERGTDLRGRLLAALSDKRLLVVLDNCEHLVEECARLAEAILGAAPAVRILATSREPLAITGESLFPVSPLPTAAPGDPPARALSFPAVRLFAERAAAVRSGFTVTPSTVDAVIQICRRLDGLPLAIELATACLRTLPLDEIAARLDDRFRLLTGGSRTALPRHQTLQAVVEGSWDLLDAAERRLARRFSVFLDGSRLDGVEAVCGGDLRTLGSLVDKSLVQLDGDRYRMLETIRAFAAERLAGSGEAERIRAAHAGYFCRRAQAAEPRLRGADQLAWLALLTADWENFTAALRWAIDSGDATTAVRLGASLGWFWNLRSAHGEAVSWLSEALALPGEVPAELRAQCLAYLGINLMTSGDVPGCRAALVEAVALCTPTAVAAAPVLAIIPALRAILLEDARDAWGLLPPALTHPDPWIRALALLLRGSLWLHRGGVAPAEQDIAAATEGFRSLGDRWGLAAVLSAQAELRALRGDNAGAIALLEEALGHSTELGVDDDLAQLHFEISRLHTRMGRLPEAQAALERAGRHARRSGVTARGFMLGLGAAELARRRGDLPAARREYRRALDALERIPSLPPEWRTAGECGMAFAAAGQGDLATAREYLRRVFEVARRQRNRPALGLTAEACAAVALAEPDPAAAALLLGLAAALRGLADSGSPDVAEATLRAREALGDGFAERYAAGAGQPLDDAITALGRHLPAEAPAPEGRAPVG
jgi:predicted ATPase/DNA-binding SARP family transcriptional activator